MTHQAAGYEFAPSTILLAQACACCGRSLRDAASVERGVGPDCAVKYGYADAQGQADWNEVGGWLAHGLKDALDHQEDGHAFAARFGAEAGFNVDAHRYANRLVHQAACVPYARRAWITSALAACGYHRLAAAVAKAAGETVLEVTVTEKEYVVRTPYEESFAPMMRDARIGAQFHRDSKTWHVPVERRARKALWAILNAVFSGARLVSPRGVTVLGLAQARGAS